MTVSLTLRSRAVGVRAGRWVRRANYLQKWIVLGAAIGLIAGLGAVAFYYLLSEATRILLGGIAGYHPPLPSGEGAGFGDGAHFERWWIIPLLVAGGGLASGILVFRFAPEAEGHGTDAAIDAVHKNPRMIRVRAVVVKLISSALTIGSGGSGGREGPTAQISAGFGSLLARWLDLSPEDGRIAVSIGIGSGIGAIFGAPLGGAVTAADIVYRDDFEIEALIPGLVASVTAYSVFGIFEGWDPLFGYAAQGYQFHRPVELLWFALIGLLSGVVGLLYAGTFYGITDLTKRLPGSRMIKPAIGGLLVGLLALAVPEALGTGYGWIQEGLTRDGLLRIPLWIVLVLPLAKILATSLSIGSGGSGGIFGPGMIVGAFVGAGVWRLFEGMRLGVPHSPAPFVIVGMMACFGAIARAPLAMMLMVAEMCGSLTILTPAMIAVGIAYLIVRHFDQTIYRSQLHNRAEAQAARLRSGMPLLDRVSVRSAMSPPILMLTARQSVAEARAALIAAGVPGAPVVDQDGLFVGAASLPAVAERADTDPDATVGSVTDPTAGRAPVTATLDEAVDAFPLDQLWLTVVDEQRRVVGVLAVSDVVRAYHRALRADVRRTASESSDTGPLEVEVSAGSTVDGSRIGSAELPSGTIVISVRRGDSVLAGTAGLRLRAGDVLVMLVRPEYREQARSAVEGRLTNP